MLRKVFRAILSSVLASVCAHCIACSAPTMPAKMMPLFVHWSESVLYLGWSCGREGHSAAANGAVERREERVEKRKNRVGKKRE